MALYWKFDPLGTAGGGKSPYFELKVATTADSLTWGFTPHIPAGGTLTVDWGDGTTNAYTGSSSTRRDHTYAAAGEYRVRLIGDATRVVFGGDASPMITYAGMVTWCNFNWGALNGLNNLQTMFYRCLNLGGICTSLPDDAVSLQSAFNNCQKLVIRIDRLPSKLSWAGGMANAFQSCYLAEINLDELAANAPAGGWTGPTVLSWAFYRCGMNNNPGTCTGSQSAFLAKFPNVNTATTANTFTDTNTTA